MDFTTIIQLVPLAIGILATLIGIGAVIKPQFMSGKFGITVQGEALPYVVCTGIRDVCIGLTMLILFYLNQWTAIGAVCLAIGVVALSDFAMVLKHGDKKTSLVHLSGAIFVVGYGAWVLL